MKKTFTLKYKIRDDELKEILLQHYKIEGLIQDDVMKYCDGMERAGRSHLLIFNIPSPLEEEVEEKN